MNNTYHLTFYYISFFVARGVTPGEEASAGRRSKSQTRKTGALSDGIAGRLRNRTGTDEEGTGGGEGDDNDSGDEDVEDETVEEPLEVQEQLNELIAISHPYHVYPSTILPRSRAAENAIQPLLYTAISHPVLPTIHCGAPSAFCNGGQEYKRRRDELDLITGDIEMGVNDRSASGAVNNEIHRLLDANKHDQDDTGVQKPKSNGIALGSQHSIYRQDGLYVNQLPIFADILMSAEDVDSLPIAKMVESNVGLARVTQRTLRELQGSLDNERMRRLWSTMLSSRKDLPVDGIARNKNKDNEKEKESNENGNKVIPKSLFHAEQHLMHVPRTPISSIAELLSQLSVGPVLKIIDDPVIDLPTQLVVPETNLAYGGVLGSWPDDASSADKLG